MCVCVYVCVALTSKQGVCVCMGEVHFAFEQCVLCVYFMCVCVYVMCVCVCVCVYSVSVCVSHCVCVCRVCVVSVVSSSLYFI